MPRTQSKKKAVAPKTKTSRRRMFLVLDPNSYSDGYMLFSAKPKVTPEVRDATGYIEDYGSIEGANGESSLFTMCQSGFEDATGLKLPDGVVAKVTITLTY